MIAPDAIRILHEAIEAHGGMDYWNNLGGNRWQNIFGLHTSYELDRVAGRYMALNDETAKVHMAYSLSTDKPLNMFDLRRKFAFLNPLLVAEYGSATFINANSTEKFEVMVSTTGLLIRKSEEGSAQ